VQGPFRNVALINIKLLGVILIIIHSNKKEEQQVRKYAPEYYI
jgi:hypothetical protein